jgi:hypothetical protein
MSKTEYRPVPALDHLDRAALTTDRTFQVIRDGEMVGTVRIKTDTSGPVASIMAESSPGVTPAEIDALGQQFADLVGPTLLKLDGYREPSDGMN